MQNIDAFGLHAVFSSILTAETPRRQSKNSVAGGVVWLGLGFFFGGCALIWGLFVFWGERGVVVFCLFGVFLAGGRRV